MKSFLITVSRRLPVLFGLSLLFLLLGYGCVLLWQARAWRDALPVLETLPAVQASAEGELELFKPDAIASLLGLVAQASLARSAEALELRASFVSTAGDSRALLAGADGERTYRVGDTLPGGSVLRRIEVAQVVFWRNGREEVLPLDMPGKRSLLPLENGSGPAPETSAPHYLQPATYRGQSD